jgi:hypothetical protein
MMGWSISIFCSFLAYYLCVCLVGGAHVAFARSFVVVVVVVLLLSNTNFHDTVTFLFFFLLNLWYLLYPSMHVDRTCQKSSGRKSGARR